MTQPIAVLYAYADGPYAGLPGETPAEMREALIGMARTAHGAGDFDAEHAETVRAWQRWLARRRAA